MYRLFLDYRAVQVCFADTCQSHTDFPSKSLGESSEHLPAAQMNTPPQRMGTCTKLLALHGTYQPVNGHSGKWDTRKKHFLAGLALREVGIHWGPGISISLGRKEPFSELQNSVWAVALGGEQPLPCRASSLLFLLPPSHSNVYLPRETSGFQSCYLWLLSVSLLLPQISWNMTFSVFPDSANRLKL